LELDELLMKVRLLKIAVATLSLLHIFWMSWLREQNTYRAVKFSQHSSDIS
jgi:hypothetical protein